MSKAMSSFAHAALAASLLACGLVGSVHAQAKTTVNAVMHAPLRVLDPIITTAHITRNHGYMVYDTLLATDKDNQIRPQMLQEWKLPLTAVPMPSSCAPASSGTMVVL
jgi:peptide/nickel transport system substrate-binding protein